MNAPQAEKSFASKTRDRVFEPESGSIAPRYARTAGTESPLKSARGADRTYSSLLQTVTTAFLTGPELLALQVEAFCTNNRKRIFDYGFVRGKSGHPLIFFIPGFGCPYNHGTVLYLAKLLNTRGFHVAVLHSPSHPEFLMTSHHSGVGGVISEDARDALIGVRAISDQLKHLGVNFKTRHLLGYSMGALNAAFACAYGQDQDEIFEKVVLINPPVDLAHGTLELDGFVRALNMSVQAKTVLIVKAGLAILAPLKLGRDRQKLIRRFLERPIWSEMELRALIGHSFESTVTGGMQVAAALGTFRKDQVVRTFSDYCHLATVPHFQKRNPGLSVNDFFASESLTRIATRLAASGNVRVLHNADDFLLRAGDAEWLKSTFGANVQIFESGGHLGNVWRPDFQASLESALGI